MRTLVILLSLISLSLQGCKHFQTTPVCPKETYAIEYVEPLDKIEVLPKGSPNTVAEITEDGIKAIQKNIQKLYKAYILNVKTLEEINKK